MMESTKEKSLARIANDFFCKNWMISTFISIVPSIVTISTSIMYHQYLGTVSKIVLLTMIVATMLFIGFKNYGAKEDIRKVANEDKYHITILEETMYLRAIDAEYKMELLENGQYEKIFNIDENPYKDGPLSPNNYIKQYCQSLATKLTNIFGTRQDDIGISVIYKEMCKRGDTNGEWKLLYSSQIGRDLDFRDIINNHQSTFSAVLDTPGKVYFKEKVNAQKEGRYISTEIERIDGLKGSIYCANISVVGKDRILPIILTITTYDSIICSDEDKNAVDKAQELFKIIGKNISFEVLRDYFFVNIGLKEDM